MGVQVPLHGKALTRAASLRKPRRDYGCDGRKGVYFLDIGIEFKKYFTRLRGNPRQGHSFTLGATLTAKSFKISPGCPPAPLVDMTLVQ